MTTMRQGPDEDPQRDVTLRPLDLAGAVGRRLPALDRPRAPRPAPTPNDPRRPGAPRSGAGETKFETLPLPEDEDDAGDDEEGRGLDDGQGVLEVRSRPDADDIDRGQEDDEGDRDRLDGQRRHPEEIREVAGGEGDGQCGDGPRVDDEEERPAEEEREERPVRLAEEDVHAARLGHGRAELGESEGAEVAEEPADDPDRKHEERRREDGGDGLGDEEDAGTDDPADDDGDDVPEPENPGQVHPVDVGVPAGLDLNGHASASPSSVLSVHGGDCSKPAPKGQQRCAIMFLC